MFLNAGKTCLVKKYDLFRERDLCSYGVLKVRCVASGLTAFGGYVFVHSRQIKYKIAV